MGVVFSAWDSNEAKFLICSGLVPQHPPITAAPAETAQEAAGPRITLIQNEATLKVGDNQRANMSISLTPKFFEDHLSVNANAKGVYNRANYPNSGAIGDAISFSPTVPVTNEDGSYFNWYSSDGSANTMASINPLSQLYEPYNVNETWRSMGNLQLDYKIHGFEDLRFNLNLGYDFSRTTGETYNELGGILSKRNGASDYYKPYANQNSNTLLEFYGNYN